jgi:competence protein ComEA
MTFYTRQQLLLILLLAGAAGAGLAVDHWRRARPELAERLEGLDRGPRRAVAPPPTRRARPAPPAAPLDLNHATESDLARLPGVGPALAARIVAARPFADVDELRHVKGVRRTTLERLRRYLIADRP